MLKDFKMKEVDVMENKLKIGVFGGARGNTMIQVLLTHPEAELVAVCDKYEPLLKKVTENAKKHNIQVACYTDFDEFLKHEMDAVVLANYANEHATYAVECLNAGKHVLSEVLPCETPAQAVELIEAVERSGKVYSYAENYCYMRHAFEMWKRYQKGDIGEIMYGEGEYIHDCASIWPRITYGERNHWRNRMHANFYCTHSIGPLLTICNLRPVSVVGFETIPPENMKELGTYRGTGIEMVTLENGAVLKSIHGDLKREPGSINYQVYGQKGMMESGRLEENKNTNVYIEGENLCEGTWEKYDPENEIASEYAKNHSSHGGSDFYSTHFFIEKILGKPDGKWSIDVYKAVEMGMCGIMAYRSVLKGNKPIELPNFRNKEERDAFRNDNACTTPEVAGDSLLPRSSFGEPEFSDECYEKVREQWLRDEQKK